MNQINTSATLSKTLNSTCANDSVVLSSRLCFGRAARRSTLRRTKRQKQSCPLLSEHPLRTPSERQKQRRAPRWLNGSSLCDPLHLHKGPFPLFIQEEVLWLGAGEDHAVTFTVLKKAYCWLFPKVLVLKAFWQLFRQSCAIQIRRALRCWQVIAVYMRQTLWRGFGQSGFNRSWLLLVSVPSSHVSSYCCLSAAPSRIKTPRCCSFSKTP